MFPFLRVALPLHAHMGQFPKQKAPLKTEILATEDLPEFTRQRVKYQIEDGVFTDAYLFTPKRVAGKLPAGVVFHQTVKTHTQQAAGVDASNPELMQGAQLARRGYVALCPRCFIFDDSAGNGSSLSGRALAAMNSLPHRITSPPTWPKRPGKRLPSCCERRCGQRPRRAWTSICR